MDRKVALLFLLAIAAVALSGCASSPAGKNHPATSPTAAPAGAAISHISGQVVDGKGNGIPGALVKLYRDDRLVPIADNPQLGSPADPAGSFDFKVHPGDLVPGYYMVRADKSDGAGTSAFSTITLYYDGKSDAIRDIRLLGFDG